MSFAGRLAVGTVPQVVVDDVVLVSLGHLGGGEAFLVLQVGVGAGGDQLLADWKASG